MMEPLRRNRRLVAAAMAALVMLALMTVTARERERITRAEAALLEIMAPLQRAVFRLGHNIRTFKDTIAELTRLYRENQRLRLRVDELAGQVDRLAEAGRENDMLRRHLDLSRRMPFDVIAAEVIGRNADNWFSMVTVDKGYSQGVRRDMVAVTPRGLVGRVTRVTSHSATVLLITDPDSGVGGMVLRSREAGVVLGRVGGARQLDMRLISPDADIEVGDTIVTSGLGMVFPRGLPVGRVKGLDVREHGLVRYASVEACADFGRLEVLLLFSGIHDQAGDFFREDEPEPLPVPHDRIRPI